MAETSIEWARWARSLRDQCRAAGVPFFGKQFDKRTPLPPDLMVRQLPLPRSGR